VKEKSTVILAKALICQRDWILSHTDPPHDPKLNCAGFEGSRGQFLADSSKFDSD
jgi:hypothetical protein